jgi:hypothetical protein
MNKNLLLGLSIAIMVSFAIYLIKSDTHSSYYVNNSEDNVLLAKYDNIPSTSMAIPSSISNLDLNKDKKTENDALDLDETDNLLKAEENKIIQPLDVQSFNSEFINTQGNSESIYSLKIESFFKNDYSKALEQMENVEYSELADNREEKLNTYLQTQLKDVQILDETVKCAARICMLNLIVSSDSNTDLITNTTKFDSNYAFSMQTKNEQGNTVYKALYIEAEDPSKLTMSN